MRGDAQGTHWSKLRTGLHSWTKRSSRTGDATSVRPGGGYSCSREIREVGRQREGEAKLEFGDEKIYAGAIDQELSMDMTGAEISTDAWSNESVTLRKKSREDCAVVFRPDHVVHWQSVGPHRQCSARLEHGGVADALSNVSP